MKIQMKRTGNDSWPLVRFIVPAYPEVNIFSGSRITPLGIINVASSASTLWGWRVEIIDENNYRGPRDENGLPDHRRLQDENPASVIGFYCGLSSTMDRVFELSRFYSDQGTVNMGGGWHAHYCPAEVLEHDFDIVIHGDGELVTRDILQALMNDSDVTGLAGISFSQDGVKKTNPPHALELEDLSSLPYPNFGLIRYARKIKTYPIGRTRGCSKHCEFCSVKGAPRSADPRSTFGVVQWLVEKRNAKHFFIVDDRLDGDRQGLLELLGLISEKYGDRLHFTVQIRLEAAKDAELLLAMQKAGIRTVCIGYESPIAEDLKSMHKGLSPKDMIEWTLVMRKYFWVHGMFIFGYPNIEPSKISVAEAVKRYEQFIRKAGISSIQVLHPVPLVGTELRARLESEGRLFPLGVVPWRMYDGSYACFLPGNMTIAELQNAPIEIMRWFYNPWSFWRIPLRTLVFPIHYLVAGWKHWHYAWLRDLVRYGGHRILLKWFSNPASRNFAATLEKHAKARRPFSRKAVPQA